MKKSVFLSAFVMIAGLVFCALSSPEADAASLRKRGVHFKEGVECKECHKVDEPTDPPSSKACLECHGPYNKLALRTSKLHANPHNSHLGQMDCQKCHGVHEPFEAEQIPCMECHNDFEFKIK